MAYYEPGDYYLCKNGRILDRIGSTTEHSKDGTTREVARYRCEDCDGCPYRAACCKARDPEKRKELVVCQEFAEYQSASLKRITSHPKTPKMTATLESTSRAASAMQTTRTTVRRWSAFLF
ncbi:MAG: transposase [Clostridia bacterium]|nr:transposase [Clostridia bacterium]